MSPKSMPMVTAHIGQGVYTNNPWCFSTRFQIETLPVWLANYRIAPDLARRVPMGEVLGLGGQCTITLYSHRALPTALKS